MYEASWVAEICAVEVCVVVVVDILETGPRESREVLVAKRDMVRMDLRSDCVRKVFLNWCKADMLNAARCNQQDGQMDGIKNRRRQY